MATKKKSDALSLVDFGDFSLDEADQTKREVEANSGGGRILKLKPGRTVMRVVPPRKGEKLFKIAHVHYLDVPGVGRVSFNCPRLMAKRKCSVCDTAAKLEATGEDMDFRKAKKLRAKQQVFINVVVRDVEENGPQPFRFGKMILDQLIEIRQDEDDGGNFAHPIEGFDLKISRKGEGQNDTEYKVTTTGARPSPLHEDAQTMREWIENQPDLSRFMRVLSDDAIDRKLRGEDADDDEDEQPRSRRRREEKEEPVRKKKSRSIDDEIEDVDDGDIELDDISF